MVDVASDNAAQPRTAPRQQRKGDYVLATKYGDGDPYDGWCVGFYDRELEYPARSRHLVTDADGNQYRRNGFRRVERITVELGEWICENRILIEAKTHQGKPLNIWRFKYGGEAARQALMAEAGMLTAFAVENGARYGWDSAPEFGALSRTAQTLATSLG